MKILFRVTAFLLTVFFASQLTSCAQKTLKPIDTADALHLYLDNADEGEYSQEERNWTCSLSSSGYSSFELCFRETSNVVKATYVCTKQATPDYMHKFQLNENLFGNAVPQSFYVMTDPSSMNYLYPIKYEEGKEYLLLLIRERRAFIQEDMFGFSANTFIPLNENGEPDFDRSTSGSHMLIERLAEEELIEAAENGNFIEQMISMIEAEHYPIEAKYLGDFIVSPDPKAILMESKNIVSISIEEKSVREDSQPFFFDRFICRVNRVLKGDIDSETIEIKLPSFAVNVGDSYIVALDESLELSSQYSMYSVEDISLVGDVLSKS